MSTRDMSKKQFLAALKRNGMRIGVMGFMGYVEVGNNLSVCRLNAGNRYRDQLAYLIERRDADEKRRTNQLKGEQA